MSPEETGHLGKISNRVLPCPGDLEDTVGKGYTEKERKAQNGIGMCSGLGELVIVIGKRKGSILFIPQPQNWGGRIG